MGSELSIQNCVSDVQSCASNASSSSGDNQDVLMVQLSQPFGMTLCSEEYEESVVKTVAECEADGNAAAAGVVDGMILLQINGVDMQPIDLDTLSQFITALPPNKIITLTFLSRNNSVPDTTHVKTNHSVPATSDNRRGNNQEPAHAATAIDKKAVRTLLLPGLSSRQQRQRRERTATAKRFLAPILMLKWSSWTRLPLLPLLLLLSAPAPAQAQAQAQAQRRKSTARLTRNRG